MLSILLNISQEYNNNLFLCNDDSQLLGNNVVKEIYDPNLPKLILNSWKDKNDDKIYTHAFIKQEEISKRWIDLYLKFEDSIKLKKHLFPNVPSCKIEDDLKKSLENVLYFLPETIRVGISDDECVSIYFEKDNKSVYWDLFFEPEQKTEASITVLENKVSKLSFTDYLDNSINKIRNEFITENELSKQTFTTI
ncbi:MAG: hypothetical protein LBU37_04580 [Tannerellaceae bacterium]|jgi:hypothetical protein|nr:hypothetical protein [Tannerellaceae bacterium]